MRFQFLFESVQRPQTDVGAACVVVYDAGVEAAASGASETVEPRSAASGGDRGLG